MQLTLDALDRALRDYDYTKGHPFLSRQRGRFLTEEAFPNARLYVSARGEVLIPAGIVLAQDVPLVTHPGLNPDRIYFLVTDPNAERRARPMPDPFVEAGRP